jgi:hypothetical protein
MTDTEEAAVAGLNDRALLIREAIARVASGDEAKAKQIGEIATAWARLVGRGEMLARDAARFRHLDTALVQSGATWVRR